MSIFDRLQPRIMDKADNLEIPVIPLSELSVIHRLKLENVHRVLVKLRSIKLFRSGDSIRWRGEPTPEQQRLLHTYQTELLEALTPQALTDQEAVIFAQWLHDIGETDKAARDYAFKRANESATERVALLWMAMGSPDKAGS